MVMDKALILASNSNVVGSSSTRAVDFEFLSNFTDTRDNCKNVQRGIFFAEKSLQYQFQYVFKFS